MGYSIAQIHPMDLKLPRGKRSQFVLAAESRVKVTVMSTKLFLIALTAFLGVSQFANAGVMLFVHFGENASDMVTSRDDLVTSYVPNGAIDKITASIYMHLTNGSNLYHYRFSVRYDSSFLRAPSFNQFWPGDFEEDGNVGSPAGPFGPSIVPSDVQHGLDIHKFNGTIDSGVFSDNRYFKVATIEFERIQPIQTPVRLIEPGKFQLSHPDVGTSGVDTFLGLSDPFDDTSTTSVDLTTEGGSVSISSVPEPISALSFGVLAALALYRRKKACAA